MRYLTSTFLFLIYSALAAQSAPSIEWQKALGGTHGESANAVQQTSDGGYIVAGNSMSNDGDVTGNHGGGDYWIVKLNPAGGIQWQKTLGGSNVDDAQSIRQTTDGGYIIAGSSNSGDGDISGNHGNYDYWIVKLDSNGNMQWQKSLGGSSSEQVNSVQQTFDGGYIIAGTTVSTDGDITVSYGNNDFWVVKLDSGGNMQWQKTLGNIGDNIGYYAQQTFDGGYIAVGTSFNSSNLESGLPDYWVIKLSNNGTIEWDKYFGGSFHDNAITIRQTPEWDYIVAGWTASNNGQVTNHHGNLDYWIIKLDSSGNLKWEKTLGGPDFDYLTALELTADNGYIVSGSTGSTSGDVTGHHGMIDAWIVKLSPEQLGIPENQQRHKPNLYPNPAKEFFYLDHLPRESTISITDMSGRKLFSQKYNEEKIKISTSAFMEGLYMVQVKNREEIILTKKITIIR